MAVDVSFKLDSCVLPSTTHCHDLGVTITSNLSSIQYITETVSKAHRRANCILRSFTSGNIRLLHHAYLEYIHQTAEYNSIIWSPVTNHNIEFVKKVQQRLNKWPRGQSVSYCSRLTQLELHTLELYSLHLDLLFCYKIVWFSRCQLL